MEAISAREFAEWMAYDRISPIDARERVELSCAIVAATIANANRGKSQRAFEPKDFMPDWSGTRRKPKSVAELFAIARSFAAAHNGALANGSHRQSSGPTVR